MEVAPISNVIPFNLPGFHINNVEYHQETLIINAQATVSTSPCPDCGCLSRRVHSYYARSPRDLSCVEYAVRLILHVRRFRCMNEACPKKTFAERLPALIPPHAQRTTRLTTALRAIAFELGGKAGARLARKLCIPMSSDTLLRIIRRTHPSAFSTPCVLGVDDWAFCKGTTYGTILVDLECHTVIDLLPDREAATWANWLKRQPGVEIISRDRSSVYAQGARQGAPHAIQVADRWHLFKNLKDALATSYERHHALLKQITIPTLNRPEIPPVLTESVPKTPADPTPPPKPKRKRPLTPLQQARQQRRQYWLTVFDQTHALHKQGLSGRAIARQLGVSQEVVRKYLGLSELPKKTCPKPGPRLIDPYKAYLHRRLSEQNLPIRQLWEEIQEQGFTGSRSTVATCVAQLRTQLGLKPLKGRSQSNYAKLPTLTARTLAALVLCQPDNLPDSRKQLIIQAGQLHPDIALATLLARSFAEQLRRQDATALDDWLQDADTCGIRGLRGFSQGIRKDYAAVKAAFTLPWSNGQVEGQVNRLKFLKRQMYGRAKFDLLRLRVLYSNLISSGKQHQTCV